MHESLYIHIPFCVRKCVYCDFFSVPYDEHLVKDYMNALCQELRLRRDSAPTLKTVYLGGGTPSLLSDEYLVQLFSCIKDNFTLSSSAEITMEANPGTLTRFKIGTIASLGVNRMSLGVQSFVDAELKTLGRIHTSADALQSIEMARESGVSNLSIDLMYGIPGQTLESWRKSLSTAIESAVTHISAYELTPEKNTPLTRLIDTGKVTMPDEETILEMYDCAIDYLADHGYKHYEISNFALPGSECIHNLNYWHRGEYIGAGAGAHSFLNETRSSNLKDIHAYIDQLGRGVLPEEGSTHITTVEALKEFIFLGLRKMRGISIEEAEQRGLDILTASKDMIAADYLEVERGMVRLTRKGTVISNTVITELFENAGL